MLPIELIHVGYTPLVYVLTLEVKILFLKMIRKDFEGEEIAPVD